MVLSNRRLLLVSMIGVVGVSVVMIRIGIVVVILRFILLLSWLMR